MEEEIIDRSEHWSYTITGNWRALDYYEDLFYFCSRSNTSEEDNLIKENGYLIPKEIWISLIDRCYDKLINFVKDQKSRLAYLVLGMFLMRHDGKMTKEIRKKILHYSNWEFEKHQFKSNEEKRIRMKYLLEFQEKVRKYVEGVNTRITEEPLNKLLKDHGPFDLTPIKYHI